MSQPFSSVQVVDCDLENDSLEKQLRNGNIDKESLDNDLEGNIEEDSLNEKLENDSLNKSLEEDSLNKSIAEKDQVRVADNNIVINNSKTTVQKDEKSRPEILCDENYCYDKFDRFFSALDFFEEPSTNKQRDRTRNSGKKVAFFKKKIPLLSYTISKTERKKCSYLEQYKKKCSKKLKKVMKESELKDSKAETNTSPASDLCSISSKPSAISIRSDSKEDTEGIGSRLDHSDDQFYYDAIQKYELCRSRHSNMNHTDSTREYTNSNVYYTDSNLDYTNKNLDHKISNLDYTNKNLDNSSSLNFNPSSREDIKQQNRPSHTSYDFIKLKSIIEEKIEQHQKSNDSIQLIYVNNEKHPRASTGVPKLNVPILTQRAVSVQNVRTIPRLVVDPNASQRSMPIQQQRSMGNQKSILKTMPCPKPIPLKRTQMSTQKLQCDQNITKSLSKLTSTEQVPKIHKNESGIHKKPWNSTLKISKSPKRPGIYPVQKQVKSQVQRENKVENSKLKPKNKTETQGGNVETKNVEVTPNLSTEYRDQICELSAQKRVENTQSETVLPALPIHEHTQKEKLRPATTNNSSLYFGSRHPFQRHKAAPRKNYVEIYQAKQNIRRLPAPLVKPPLVKPSLVRLYTKKKMRDTTEVGDSMTKEKVDVKIERNIKTPNRKINSAKTGERNKLPTKPLKRYYLKKKAPNEDEALEPEEENKEDIQLKLLEEKKQQLERQLQTINSKSRSTNVVIQA